MILPILRIQAFVPFLYLNGVKSLTHERAEADILGVLTLLLR